VSYGDTHVDDTLTRMLSDPERQEFERLVAELDEESLGDEVFRKSVAFGWIVLAAFAGLMVLTVFLMTVHPLVAIVSWSAAVGLVVWSAPRLKAGYLRLAWDRFVESVRLRAAERMRSRRHRDL
jgi:hypothetical protein